MKKNSHHDKSYTLLPPARLFPVAVTRCPRCGGEVDLLSEEEETICAFCGQKLFERETTTH